MTHKDDPPRDLQDILARRAPPAFDLSREERAVIEREQRQRIDELFQKELEELARRVFQPRLAPPVVTGDDKTTALVRETLARFGEAPRVQAVRPRERPPTARERVADAVASCLVQLRTPPYTFGWPNPESVGADAEGLPFFKTSSSLSLDDRGVLSVGVANGRFLGLANYSSSDGWLFGDANSTQANLLETISLPGAPTTTLSLVQITADIRVGETPRIQEVALLPGATGSTGSGLVGVLGKAYLTLLGPRSLGGPPASSELFLLMWRDNASASESMFERDFSLSGTLVFLPGATWVAAIVSVRLMAFRAGVDDPLAGFSGVDLRARDVTTQPLWFLQPAAGPILVPTIGFTYCPLVFLPPEVVRALAG